MDGYIDRSQVKADLNNGVGKESGKERLPAHSPPYSRGRNHSELSGKMCGNVGGGEVCLVQRPVGDAYPGKGQKAGKVVCRNPLQA